MPGSVEVIDLCLRQAGNLEVDHQLVEDAPVDLIDRHPGHLTRAHPIHPRPVSTSPTVRKGSPVCRNPLGPPEYHALPNNRAAPVDHGTEDVEGQCGDS